LKKPTTAAPSARPQLLRRAGKPSARKTLLGKSKRGHVVSAKLSPHRGVRIPVQCTSARAPTTRTRLRALARIGIAINERAHKL